MTERLKERLLLGTKVGDNGRGCSEYRSTTLEREALARITQLEAEVERLALRYEKQSKFADPDFAVHFRDFARHLRAALHPQGDRKP